MYAKLQYISQGTTIPEQLSNIQYTLDSGCQWIQLRFKNAKHSDLIALAQKVKYLSENYQATFIMNDHVDIAHLVNSDGVHLGLLDTSIESARRILGSTKIIGGTANTLADLQKRIDSGCDYIGLGPLRFTETKQNLSPILGFAGITTIMNILQQQAKMIPIYAIGGIILEDLDSLKTTGVYGIAVSGLITNCLNKKDLISKIHQVFKSSY